MMHLWCSYSRSRLLTSPTAVSHRLNKPMKRLLQTPATLAGKKATQSSDASPLKYHGYTICRFFPSFPKTFLPVAFFRTRRASQEELHTTPTRNAFFPCKHLSFSTRAREWTPNMAVKICMPLFFWKSAAHPNNSWMKNTVFKLQNHKLTSWLFSQRNTVSSNFKECDNNSKSDPAW